MFTSAIKKYCRYLVLFYRALGWRLALTVVLGLGVGLLDGIGIAMFVPLIGMTDVASGRLPIANMGALGSLLGLLTSAGFELTLMNVLLLMVAMFVMKGCLQFADDYYRVLLRTRFMVTLRTSLTKGLARLSYAKFLGSSAGELQNTLSTEVVRTLGAFTQYFAAFQATILLLVYFGLAIAANPQFAVLVLIGMGAMSLGYQKLHQGTRRLSKQLSTKGHGYHGLLLQSIHLFKYLKATAQGEAYCQRLNSNIREMESMQRRMGLLHSLTIAIREPVVVLMIVVVILIETTFFGGSISTVILSIAFFYRAVGALMTVQTSYGAFLQASGAMETTHALQETLDQGRERSGKRPYSGLQGELEVRDVSFEYGNGKSVLTDIALTIKKHEMIAFVGESGSGKTTLVNILAGLLTPSSGGIYLDGVNLRELKLDDYRSRIGYITQEPVVFAETIYNNVTFFAPKTAENLEQFWKVCEAAAIRDCIESLKDAEDSLVGDNGVLLSGGQRQRISIARELFRKPEILFLDEATSALDSETEGSVQENIELLRGQCTIIVVAHRLSTVRAADRIFALQNGQLTGEGSFAELMQTSPAFSRMVELQSILAAPAVASP